ncbi:hypothetical protein SE17_37260 [Kouleothrix aurantiaca]|uniref:Uncharacterized protein n=1 Tax=Kouleothrix aurantiaca TaxID=186479 RepID=A0A0P9DET7_9CHLR|nr:hypothetical protein SE17_37260 [Kouleothrix aurantiaca]
MQHISERRRAQRQLAIARVGLVVAFVGFATLAAALFYQGSTAPAPALDEPGALARAFAASPLVQMSLFGAVAFGYTYWVIDLTFGRKLGQFPRLRRVASALFGLAVLAAFMGLMAWNLAVLHGVA